MTPPSAPDAGLREDEEEYGPSDAEAMIYTHPRWGHPVSWFDLLSERWHVNSFQSSLRSKTKCNRRRVGGQVTDPCFNPHFVARRSATTAPANLPAWYTEHRESAGWRFGQGLRILPARPGGISRELNGSSTPLSPERVWVRIPGAGAAATGRRHPVLASRG